MTEEIRTEIPILPPLASQTDGELIDRFLDGRTEAFEELMNRYEPRIYAFGYRMCGRHEDALDLTQETFLTVYQSLGSLRVKEALTSWIYRIATNICLLKKQKGKREVTWDPSMEEILPTCDADGWPEISDWSRAPDEQAINQELRQSIDRAALELPLKYRMVFVLRDLQGLSVAETAEILGISENLVKVQLHRARLQLRKKLEHFFQRVS